MSQISFVQLKKYWPKPISRLFHSIRNRGGLWICLKLVLRKYEEGWSWKAVLQRILSEAQNSSFRGIQPSEYFEWQERFEKLTVQDLSAIRKQIQELQDPPLISLLMPVYNTAPDLLRQAIDSVRNQIYPHWELCIADDASPNPEIKIILEDYCRIDSRIHVVFRKSNGNICAASNSALELCTGTYTALMDHDDLLPEIALYFVAVEIIQHPDVMLIYSDEDKLSPEGERYGPYFKPDWNEPLLLAQNYFNHLCVYNTSLIREIGGFRLGYEGSQDHDLVLRSALKIRPDQIRHIPRILYHWRQFSGSGSFSDKALDCCEKSRRQALADYLAAKGRDATVTRGYAGYNKVNYKIKKLPMVSCIVPARNHAELTQTCLDGLLHHTDYAPLEIILVDNGSTDEDAILLCKSFGEDPRVRVIHWDKPFNYSEINNMAAREACGEVLALLNNDIKVIHSDWLQRLVAYAMQPDTGAVGPKLLYANDEIQHAGVIRGCGGCAGHLCRGFPRESSVLYGQLQLTRWVSVVTGACLVVRKELFFEVGGLDEQGLKIAFNDVDFCLKLHEKGYHNTYVGDVELYHLESVSRGYEDTPEKQERFSQEISTMVGRWGEQLLWDPFYSAHYSRCYTSPVLLKAHESPYLPKDYVWKPWEKI